MLPSQRQVGPSEAGQVGGLRDSPASWCRFTYCCRYLLAGLRGALLTLYCSGPQASNRNSQIVTSLGLLGHSWWVSDKEFTCNAGEAGFISGWGRSPGEKICNSIILAWEITWTETCGLQSMGLQRVRLSNNKNGTRLECVYNHSSEIATGKKR